MNIEEMKQQQRQCENQISELLNEFARTTGCTIEALDMESHRVRRIGASYDEHVYEASFRVVL